jgi:hypothetical protein
MILGYDKGTEKKGNFGKYTYLCRQMVNLETRKYNKKTEYSMPNSEVN